jgi:3-oxoacyl-[acyl-carrier protein] reductase
VDAARKVAVVTGAGSGIGRATAAALAARGCDVALLGRKPAPLADAARALTEQGRTCAAIVCDVRRAPDVEHAAREVVAKLGAASVVVCAAGVVARARVQEHEEHAWDEVVDTNLKGTFLVARAFLGDMLAAKSGRVVCVGSISSTLGTPRLSAYCASKWGVLGFTKALAEELRGTGVQTMCVMPGSVDTAMLEGSGFTPDMSPEDVARLIVYAALDAPDALNGSALEMFGP